VLLPPRLATLDVSSTEWSVAAKAALYPQYRGLGIGRQLMELAHRQARRCGYNRVSLVAFAQNQVAVRLHRRLGYRVIDQAPIVPHPLIRCTREALLMVCEV
jgi:ribosomal protein S18 acetylase RimI-like enzyme